MCYHLNSLKTRPSINLFKIYRLKIKKLYEQTWSSMEKQTYEITQVDDYISQPRSLTIFFGFPSSFIYRRSSGWKNLQDQDHPLASHESFSLILILHTTVILTIFRNRVFHEKVSFLSRAILHVSRQ
jgi:hypothetical protein